MSVTMLVIQAHIAPVATVLTNGVAVLVMVLVIPQTLVTRICYHQLSQRWINLIKSN